MCERERASERERRRESERERERKRETERERENVCVRECVCVCVRERHTLTHKNIFVQAPSASVQWRCTEAHRGLVSTEV